MEYGVAHFEHFEHFEHFDSILTTTVSDYSLISSESTTLSISGPPRRLTNRPPAGGEQGGEDPAWEGGVRGAAAGKARGIE